VVPGRFRSERPPRRLNRPRYRARGSGSLVVATAALAFLALGLVALGISLRSEASDLRSEAVPELERMRVQMDA
jgi:hypothetical protein